eukprot:1178175-Prorocentrum_minimum.AAC.2
MCIRPFSGRVSASTASHLLDALRAAHSVLRDHLHSRSTVTVQSQYAHRTPVLRNPKTSLCTFNDSTTITRPTCSTTAIGSTYTQPSAIGPTYTQPSAIGPPYPQPSAIGPTYTQPSAIGPPYTQPSVIGPTYTQPSAIGPPYTQ